MKTELNSPLKLKIPFELLTGDKDNFPYSKLGIYIKAVLDCDEDEIINVSKIWINEKTDEKLDELTVEYLRKIQKLSIKTAKREASMYKLQYGPAMDFQGTFNLEDDYIYVEEDAVIKNSNNIFDDGKVI